MAERGGRAVASGLVTLLGAIVAVYTLVERRLGRLETLNEEYPPKEMHARLRTMEDELASLRVLKSMLIQYGEDAARDAVRRGTSK